MAIPATPAVILSRASDAITIDAEPESLTIGVATTALVVVDNVIDALLSKPV
jgi:hypothetical protein